jgi:hypothetical protein
MDVWESKRQQMILQKKRKKEERKKDLCLRIRNIVSKHISDICIITVEKIQ